MIDFLIIGAQKAATSTLQTALRRYPGIHMPERESAYFEEPDFAQRPWEDFGSGLPAEIVKGIKRPDYLCSDQAVERISEALPQARFIVVLREPVARAVSSYCHLVRHAHLPALSLDAGMTRCLDAFEDADVGRAASIVRFGLYGRYLEQWYARYPRERFLILSQKLVSDEPLDALTRCAAHLDVNPRAVPIGVAGQCIGRRNVGLYDPRMLRIARLGSLLKTRAIPGTTRREARGLIMRGAGCALSGSAELLARLHGQRGETLSPENRDRLAAHYAADLPRLKACAPAEALYWTE